VRKVFIASLLVLRLVTPSWAGDYLFLNSAYASLTEDVLNEADLWSKDVFKDPALLQKYQAASGDLRARIEEAQVDQRFKKMKAEDVADVKDAAFAASLNAFKDFLNEMESSSGKPLPELLPSYAAWTHREIEIVKAGLDKRLGAYQTRFGPESEQINIVELLISQRFMAGDESGPQPWEPILRVVPVQITSRGEGLTSTAQLGMNYYFLDGAPKPLRLLGIANHVGAAVTLQYLDHPGPFEVKGKPSIGLLLHFDRKEAGVAYDPTDDRIRFTLGYSFQFIPLVM
jgi:hypothetical protein